MALILPLLFASSLAVAETTSDAQVSVETPPEVIENIEAPTEEKPLPYAALYQAVAADELYTAITMIEAGAKDTDHDPQGKNALLLAAEKKMPHIITLLVEDGADINVQDSLGNSALHLAVAANDLYTSKMLIERGIDKKLVNSRHYTALHEAAETAGVEMVEMLLEMGMDPLFTNNPTRVHTAYDVAGESKRWDVTALFRKHGFDKGAHINASYGDIQAFIEYKNNNVTKFQPQGRMGYSPLHFATAMGHYDLVKLMLENDANPRWSTAEGLECTTIAIQHSHKDIFNLFLEYGLDINSRDSSFYGNTPLIHATRSGNLEMINFLLDLGAYIGGPSALGDTPLHNAVDSNQIESARLLLDRGAVVGLLPSRKISWRWRNCLYRMAQT
jgi:ankyrin repeat protein